MRQEGEGWSREREVRKDRWNRAGEGGGGRMGRTGRRINLKRGRRERDRVEGCKEDGGGRGME